MQRCCDEFQKHKVIASLSPGQHLSGDNVTAQLALRIAAKRRADPEPNFMTNADSVSSFWLQIRIDVIAWIWQLWRIQVLMLLQIDGKRWNMSCTSTDADDSLTDLT